MSNLEINKEYTSYATLPSDGKSQNISVENHRAEGSIFGLDSIGADDVFKSEDISISADSLRAELKAVKDEQGIFGKAWNGLKNLLGLGLGSKKVENKIEQYEKGEISYQEALESIELFDSKQEGAVNLFANVATGVATAGFAAATGGIGAIAMGAAVGGAAKAGLKTLDRATNNVKGDEFETKQILKDTITGAVDGAISTVTAGMIKAPVAGQSVKQAVIKGAVKGAEAGAISGGVTGATDYAVEAAFEKDVDFSVDSLLEQGAKTALAGGVMGGILGGVTSGVAQSKLNKANANATRKVNKPKSEPKRKGELEVSHDKHLGDPVDRPAQAQEYLDNYCANKKVTMEPDDFAARAGKLEGLSERAEELAVRFDGQIDEAAEQVGQVFSDRSQVEVITARSKGQKSVFSKLASKNLDGTPLETMDECYEAIGDALGIRLQMSSVSVDTSRETVEAVLRSNGISATYDDFVRCLRADSTLDSTLAARLQGVSEEVLDALKTKQSQTIVDQLVDGIKSGKIFVTELNNYGDEISSYFTHAQIQEIADAHAIAVQKGFAPADKPFAIVNRQNVLQSADTKVMPDASEVLEYGSDATKATFKQKTKGSKKVSGYTSSQMNTTHKLKDGSTGYGELQVRGTKVNDFADVEHIPYDIRKGKINANDPKYADIYKIIKGMDEDTVYKAYNQYLSDTYRALRMQELGLLADSAPMPVLADYISDPSITGDMMKMLDMKGLIAISKRGH